MNEKNKQQLGIVVPKWIRFTLIVLERASPYIAMRVAAYIFSKPIKFTPPPAEKQALQSCVQNQVFVPSLNKNIMTYVWGDSGEKVLLVHGWSGRGTQLYKIAEILQNEGYQVVSFDAPGHGKSSGSLTNMLHMVAAIAHLDKSFDGFEFFVGHSLGGMALFNYCKTPNKAKKVITIGAGDLMRTVFDNFIASVGLSLKTNVRMTTYFEQKYNINIDHFSSSVVVQNQQMPTLIIHDKEDADVAVSCAFNIAKNHLNPTLLITQGLGHRRILRDENVLQQIKSFIQS